MMNFSPFTGHIPAAMPTIHQFAAKFGYEGGAPAQEGRGYGQYAQHEPEPPAKFRQENAVVSLQSAPGGLNAVNSGVKYQTIASSAGALSMQQYSGHVYAQAGGGAGGGGGGAGAGDAHAQLLKADAKREYREEMAQELMGGMMQQAPQQGVQHPQQLVVLLHDPKEASKPIKQELRADARLAAQPAEFISAVPAAAWQSLAGAGGAVADYLSSLPLGLHHLLKYSADGAKREDGDLLAGGLGANMSSNVSGVVVQASSLASQPNGGCNPAGAKRKKKKKPAKERKPRPRPGEIRLTTALDGSTLYCCPECHMAYPERGLLEQHLVGHTMERRFICDICNAALKRKDHLTRHKQSHNPERPYVCSVCLKAFKRKEQLTLHFVIHSGEKRHVCQECGKGFYRKDHLRKHTRSHIARRVKAELTQQSAAASAALARAVPAPPLAAPPHPAPPP